jgi:hypothetical protein
LGDPRILTRVEKQKKNDFLVLFFGCSLPDAITAAKVGPFVVQRSNDESCYGNEEVDLPEAIPPSSVVSSSTDSPERSLFSSN